MPPTDFEVVFAALQRAGVRYLVVGGVAVVLHGHPRFTADLDLIVALEPTNALAAMRALAELGYRPRASVPAESFADPDARREWVKEKGLTVFSMWSEAHPATEIDLFVEEPFPFDDAYARADLAGGEVPVACIADLIELKRRMPDEPRDAHEIQQRRRWKALTHAERLAWLWQAKQFVARAKGACRKSGARRGDDSSSG